MVTPAPSNVPLPVQPYSQALLRAQYAQPGERDAQDVIERVAGALAQAEPHAQRQTWCDRFREAMLRGFVPAGRILAAAGGAAPRTWASCFVQPLHALSSQAALAQAWSQTALTLQAGGGVGLDLSALAAAVPQPRPIEPQPDPLSVLQHFEAGCEALEACGSRRGAQMAVLRVDHPGLEAFIHAKDQAGLRHFNLSVGITDTFMQEVLSGREGGQGQAHDLWAQIVHAAWDHGDPGLLFLDTINRENPLAAMERIACTNPCGEQPLPPNGSCCLGSLDLTRFVLDPFQASARVDLPALARTAAVGVRMLDNAIDLSPWPRAAQADEARAKRRIGLGVMGLADALILLNLRYESPAARTQAARIAHALREAAVRASTALARAKGPFPAFRSSGYLQAGGYAARLPEPLRLRIAREGLRNSHLLSLAPCGSISLAMADGVSPGVEPVARWRAQRSLGVGANRRTFEVQDAAWRTYRALRGPEAPLPPAFQTAWEVPPDAHVAMVATLAPYVDGGISKTVNLPPSATAAAVDAVYRAAWFRGLKGITVYRPHSMAAEA